MFAELSKLCVGFLSVWLVLSEAANVISLLGFSAPCRSHTDKSPHSPVPHLLAVAECGKMFFFQFTLSKNVASHCGSHSGISFKMAGTVKANVFFFLNVELMFGVVLFMNRLHG